MRTLVTCCFLLALALIAVPLAATVPQEVTHQTVDEEPIFDSGFESGNVEEWSASQGFGHPISWEPEQVDLTAGANSSTTVNIVFDVNSDLPPTTVWINPGIDEVVSVATTQLPALSKGTEVPLLLTIRPQGIVGQWEGTLHIRQADGPPRTFARPLPIRITSVEGDGLPPDPDPDENDSTLEGIDSNGDDIRDDVERFIAAEWSDPADRAALRQYASKLTLLFDQNQYDEAAIALIRARFCLHYVRGVYDKVEVSDYLAARRESMRALDSVRAEVMNTEERFRAYFSFEASRKGATARPPRSKDLCEFDVEAIQ